MRKMNWKKDELHNANRASQYYDGLYHSQIINQKQEEDLVKFIKQNVHPGARILDMGCGTGTLSRLLSKDFVVVGLDISKEMLLYSTTQSIQADGEMIPFNARVFDAVICSNTLHHYPILNPVLSEIRRVLKADGKIIILEPNKEFVGNNQVLSQAMYLLTGALHKLGFEKYQNNITFNETTDHHRALTVDELSKSLSEAKFKYDVTGKYVIAHYFTDFKNGILCDAVLVVDKVLRLFVPKKERYIIILGRLI